MKKVFIQVCILLFLSCSDNVDFNYINKLLEDERFEETITYISSIDSHAIADSLDLKKLQHKLLIAQKGSEFNKMAKLLNNADTTLFITRMDSINRVILNMDSLKQRWYRFDYYLQKAKYFRTKNDTDNWLSAAVKSLDFPANRQDYKITVSMDVAFHFAEQGQFENSREWMDKAIRGINLSGNKLYNQVYTEYMNGKFKKAAELIETNTQHSEIKHWQRFQSFLKFYSDSLTIENRFRLW